MLRTGLSAALVVAVAATLASACEPSKGLSGTAEDGVQEALHVVVRPDGNTVVNSDTTVDQSPEDLSRRVDQATSAATGSVALRIDADGKISWNGQSVSRDELAHLMDEAASASPKPEVHILPNKDASFKAVAEIFSMARDHGLEDKLSVIGGT